MESEVLESETVSTGPLENRKLISAEQATPEPEKANPSDKIISNATLLRMLKEQRDIISMMQIQMDLQAEKLNSQEKLLQELKAIVEKQQETSGLVHEPNTIQATGSNDKIKDVENDVDWVSATTTPSTQPLSIADLVRKAAEETLAEQAATAMASYTYDEASGLYYDHSSGYYYDAVQGLFYNGHTRTYYVYDQESQSYIFHSQLPEPEQTNLSIGMTAKKKRKSKKKSIDKSEKVVSSSTSPNYKADSNMVINPEFKPQLKSLKFECVQLSPSCEDVEEGELSPSSHGSSSPIGQGDGHADDNDGSDTDTDTVTSQDSNSTTESRKREESLPCVRAIVMETSVPSLQKGFLYIVTCMGGSLGREGSMHSILIPDPNLSKHHAGMHFSNEDGNFYITDLGSQNGTYLNGNRLSEPKVLSDAHQILHGSTLKVGSTTLLLHIHPGSFTCGLCEPGLISAVKEPLFSVSLTKEKKEVLRKKQLKKLRQKYGVEKHETESLSKLPEHYKDRAIERRVNKGSDNPFEKTQVASADVPIKEDNKGFRMLAKMGWNAGDALGRSPPHNPSKDLKVNSDPNSSHIKPLTSQSNALLEPIKVDIRPGRVGLGFPVQGKNVSSVSIPAARNLLKSSNPSNSRGKQSRAKIVEKTLKRFNEARGEEDSSDVSFICVTQKSVKDNVEVIDVD